MGYPNSPTANQLVEWIDRIVREAVNTTAWEDQFIEDMQGKVERYGDRVSFTEAQAEIIERVYSQRVP